MSPRVDRAAALAAVKSVMSRVFGVPPDILTEATTAASIERWDSLNIVLITIGLERRLGLQLDVSACAGAVSVGALLDVLCACGGRDLDAS
jgi:acyl carrier protein